MNTRTAEYAFILRNHDLAFEGIESESEFGTTYYSIVIYWRSKLLDKLSKKEKEQYELEGIVPFLDRDYVYIGETFEEALKTAYNDIFEEGLV